MKNLLISTVLIFSSAVSSALVLDFSGNYRFEGFQMENAELDAIKRDKSYILHHLYLKPKIIAADGLNIYSRFDMFNNANYPNSQMGETFGQGPGDGTPTTENDSNVLSQNQESQSFVVNELYLSAISEYGQFIAGRKMFHFGLGISHNGGNGPFDHWFDSKDMVGFNMAIGNFTFMPAYAKVNEGRYNLGDDINDFIVDLQYNNPETNIRFGILYESRVSTTQSNDAPVGTGAGTAYGGAGASKTGDLASQRLNLYYERKFETVRVGFEAATNTGSTGIETAVEEVSVNAVGVAFEIDYKPTTSKWSWGLKSAYASGDDPNTDGKYEGFIFDRNYDLTMLLGNHPMGMYSPFRTQFVRNAQMNGDTSASAFADEEALSNILLFVPEMTYAWKQNLDLTFKLAFGQLNVQPILNNEVDTDLGYELDIYLNYRPYDRLQWISGLGVFMPGGAYTGGTNNFETNTAFALTTKAAISF